MAKVMAAKGFTVRLRVPAAPGYCKPFFDHQLDVRRADPQRPRLAAVRIGAQAASVSPSQALASARCAGSIWWPSSDSR